MMAWRIGKQLEQYGWQDFCILYEVKISHDYINCEVTPVYILGAYNAEVVKRLIN